MKIGIVCYPSFGGSGVVATELGAVLARRGHEVHFISYEPPGRLSGEGEGIRYHEVAMSTYPLFKYPPYLLAMASKMADTAEMEELDLLHVHYAIPHAISACLAREIVQGRRLPVVTTLHGTDITLVGRQPAFSRLVKHALERSSGLTAVSRSLAADTMVLFGFQGRIEVIPNFVDLERFRPGVGDGFRARRTEPGEKVLVHVSNFRRVKNTPQVIKAFARVAREMSARLFLLGDGPDLSLCVQEAAAAGVADRVHFLAETPRVEEVIAAADLFLLPSSQESFGLAALEAMACGVPVLAYRVGGLPEVVEMGGGGRLFPAGDWEALAAGAIDLLGDEEERKLLGRRGREAAAERFSEEEVVPLYERYYERVLAGSP